MPKPTLLLDHTTYPHIFDLILTFADDGVLRAIRASGRHAADRADRVLYSHVVVDPVSPATLPFASSSPSSASSSLSCSISPLPASASSSSPWASSTSSPFLGRESVTPVLTLRTPHGKRLPSHPTWLLAWSKTQSPSPRLQRIAAFVEVTDYLLGPAASISTFAETLLSSTKWTGPQVLRIVAGNQRYRPQADLLLLTGSTTVHFVRMTLHQQMISVRAMIPVNACHHLVHVAYDEGLARAGVEGLARGCVDMPALGGMRSGRGGEEEPQSVVFHFEQSSSVQATMQGGESHASAPAPAQTARNMGGSPPPKLGALAWCVPQLVAHPTTAFTFVGVEGLPPSAIPALNATAANSFTPPSSADEAKNTIKAEACVEAWPCRRERLTSLLVDAVTLHPRKSTDPSLAMPIVSFLTEEEYRAQVGEARFALGSVPPRVTST